MNFLILTKFRSEGEMQVLKKRPEKVYQTSGSNVKSHTQGRYCMSSTKERCAFVKCIQNSMCISFDEHLVYASSV